MTTSETLKTRTSRISGFLGLQRSSAGVLGMVVLVGMGERMAERFLPIYMLALGGGVLAIGLLQAMDNLLSALYSFPGGYLSDRIGTRKSLLIFNLVAIAGFALVVIVPNWQAVLIGAVLVYIPVAYLADRGTKKPFVLMTFVFFALFPIVLLYSHSFEWLVPAFVLRGLKEFGEPTRKALIMDLSPDHCKAAMFGLYYLIRDVFVSLAAFGGAFLWQINPEVNLIAAFIFGIIGTIGFAIFGRDVPLMNQGESGR
jgi:MFS family permease